MNDSTKVRKPRATGKLTWLRIDDVGLLLPLGDQPDYSDIAAATKWLSEQVAADALPEGTGYALHRAICTVTPRVEVTRKAVL